MSPKLDEFVEGSTSIPKKITQENNTKTNILFHELNRVSNKERVGNKVQVESYQLKSYTDYFILSTVYDAKFNGAGIKLYDTANQRVLYINDPYGHVPYCLSREPIEKLEQYKFPKGTIKRFESINKKDLLASSEVNLTKIYTPTPSEVPKVRDVLGDTWESKIKYHQNWLYDTQLVPGRKYWWDEENYKFIEAKSSTSGMNIPDTALNYLKQYEGLIDVFIDDFTQEIPDMPVVACDIETEYEEGQIPQPSDPKFRIICICLVDNRGKEYALVLNRDEIDRGEKTEIIPSELIIERFTAEEDLIKRAFELLVKYTVVTSFNGDNFDFPYLHERARHLKIRETNPIIWNKRSGDCNFKSALHLDLYRFYHNIAIKTYAFGNKYREENLNAIAEALLGIGKLKISTGISELPEWELINYCLRDAKITLDLLLFDEKTPLNLIFILSRVSRTPIDDLVRTSVSTWVKSLFYFEHRRRGLLIPNPEDLLIKGTQASSEAIIKGKKYKGARVIDPVPGVHFNVAVLDFASLYPSIIGTFNLSYETILCNHEKCKENHVPQTKYWVCQENRGIMSDIIGFIKDVRVRWIKPESKRKSSNQIFNRILERSLKVLINASYGVLGSDRFPLYCLPVADSTTAYGRDAIEKTIQKAQILGIKVLYGDTDSVFLENPSKQEIEEIINWSTAELEVSLEMEKIYRYVVLSERKKNYFGVYPDSSVDVKGLMGKKRNTPMFLQDGFADVLKILSEVHSEEDFDIAKNKVKELVKNIYQKLENGKYTGEDLAITMQLTQPLHAYKVNAQHVKAAKQLENSLQKQYKKTHDGNSSNKSFIKAGQLIKYIKTQTDKHVIPLELYTEDTKIDIKSYRSMIDSIFDQLFGALDIDTTEVATGQINLMDFFG
ncbi:MAG: DNA-directed DNA polymerase I [Candidatus Heimdallarchaeota archaeon]|nr:DNA-directed DNA polymerase I [Candidatus Heimdallarchaeota archaeon]